jgi:enterochelin esterase-like enzyme
MIEWLSISSQAIKGFPMGDAHQRKFPVLLPPDYVAGQHKKPYPVIFLLAGYPYRSAKYMSGGSAFAQPLHKQIEAAMLSGEMPPAIIVMPDATSRLGHSQYINSPVLGNYMDYLADELVELIDSRYPTHASAAFRGVAGHSSGGFGALMLGMMRADRFQNICASAADAFFEVSLLPMVNDAVVSIEKAGGIAAFIEQFMQLPDPNCCSKRQFITMMTLAMAPCYAPNPDNAPLYGDVFFDLNTGAIKQEVWQRYLAWDPVNKMDQHLEALRSLRWLHLACGEEDEYAMQLGHRQIAAKLTEYQIQHFFEEYPGGHSGQNWRFVERLQKMLTRM